MYGTTIQKNTIFCFSTIFFSQSHEKIIFLKSQPSCIHYSMTSSPSLTSNNFIITHHLNTLHNNVGNYFEFICMKTSLTMFDNSDTFENFFLFGCYKLSSVNHQQTFFIHDHQQQLHPSKTFSFMIINNNFINHHQQTFSFMIINNNFIHHPSKNFFHS